MLNAVESVDSFLSDVPPAGALGSAAWILGGARRVFERLSLLGTQGTNGVSAFRPPGLYGCGRHVNRKVAVRPWSLPRSGGHARALGRGAGRARDGEPADGRAARPVRAGPGADIRAHD